MNILFLTNELNYTCGITNHIHNLVYGLSKLNEINMSVICGGGDGADMFKEFDIDIKTDKTFLHKSRGYLDFAKAAYKLISFVKKNKIELLHSHTYYTAKLAHEASKFTKAKTVHTIHSIQETQGGLRRCKTDKIIAVSRHIYELAIKEEITDKENLTLITYGIRIPPEPVWKAKARIKVLSILKEKGLDTFIEAVSLLPESYRINAEFIIAGEGETEKLKKLNKQLSANVQFPGKITDIASLLRGSHIFVSPSFSPTSGFPPEAAEAAAYNNLIITPKFKDSVFPFFGDIDGLIFGEGNPYDLMIKLKLAIDNYETFKPMAEHFYLRVKEMYNLNTMVQKHLELYDECLRNR